MTPSRPLELDPAELLRHEQWLRRVARSLVSGADVDDLVQETWAQTFARRPDRGHSLRGWLAAVARRLAARHWRTLERRQRREQRAGRAPEVPPTEETIALLELQRRVSAAVSAMAEPYRTTILLRYFHDLSIAAIAARDGIREDAVRKRIARGLDHLAAQMREVHGADWRRVPGLLALAGPPQGAIAATWITGTLLMSKSAKALVAAFVLVALMTGIGWSIGFGSPPGAPGSTGGAMRDAANVATTHTPADVDAGNESPQRTAAEVPAAWVVRGEVMHGSVAPLPNARFTARAFAGWQAGTTPLHEATLTSDANGAFEWSLPAPTGPVTLTFAQCRADTSITADSRTVLASEGPPQDVTVFAFLKDCQVTGSVTDEAGRPVAGAWVKGGPTDREEPCDAAGRYRVLVSATYGDVALFAGARGYVLGRQHVKVKGRGAHVVIDFQLKEAVRIVGRVTDEDGAPVAGASVKTFETFAAPALTDADGRYELTHIDSTLERHTVQVDHDDYLTSQRYLTPAQLGESCDVVLKRGATLRGRVLADDRPVEGAHIHFSDGIGYFGRARAVSRDDGTFEARNLRPGRSCLTVFARGHATAQRFLVVDSEMPDTIVRLEPGHTLAGRVVDRSNKGLHRVRVTPLSRGMGAQIGAETHTARDGSFRLTDLPAGKITLDCFGMQVTRKNEEVDVDRADVVVVMPPPARLAGRVLDDATGLPLQRFSIRFVAPELRGGERRGGEYGVEWVKGLVFEDAEGRWNTDGERLAEGTVFGVEASADGYGPAVARRVQPTVDAAPDSIVLRLRPAARIVGRVVDQGSGEGIAGAHLFAFDADHPLADRESDTRLSCQTRADGTFELAGVPAGRLSLAFQHPDRPLTFDGPFDTAPGTTTTRTLSIRAGATLSGTALDLTGNPVAGVNVAREIVDIQGLRVPHASVATDAAGRFRFPALPAAEYWLVANGLLPDGSTIVYSRNVDVADGDVDVPLQPAGRASLEVELLSTDALPKSMFAYISRTVSREGERPFNCTVSGSPFVVRGLPEGEYRVMLSAGGANSISGMGSCKIGADGTSRIQISLTTRR